MFSVLGMMANRCCLKQLAHSYHQEAARVSPVGGVGNPLLEQREPLSENIFKKFFNEPIQVSKNINVES